MLTAPVHSADTEQVLVECTQSSVDERGVAACLEISLAEAVQTLENTEANWQRLLDLDVKNEGINAASQDTGPGNSIEATKQGGSNSTVIAIVNDSALQSGLSAQGSNTINVDDESNPNAQPAEPSIDTRFDIKNRFSFLPALFRSFRDQHCAVEASLFGADRVEIYKQACLVGRTRLRNKELNRWLALRRTLTNGGRSYRGYYVKTNSGAAFQACDRKVDWWVAGSDAVLSSLDRRYADIGNQGFGNAQAAIFYAELRGNVTSAPVVGSGADYSATLNVERISLFRPLTKTDCVNTSMLAGTDQTQALSSEQGGDLYVSTAATVDDYASAGFSYGYFNFWVSACAVTNLSVCSTETDAQFASDGDWQLRLDRSLEGDWRLQLIATTEDQVIEKQLKMQIDGAEVYLGNNLQQPLGLPMRQGVDIAVGELARELIIKLRAGREVRFEWQDESDVASELRFSLLGVTRALQFFDQSKP